MPAHAGQLESHNDPTSLGELLSGKPGADFLRGSTALLQMLRTCF